MSGVNAASGTQGSANTEKPSSAKAQQAQKEKAPNSVVNNGKSKKAAVPKEPKRKEITVTLQSGTSLLSIASKYDTTVGAICKLNGISNPDRVSEGQKIRVMAYDPKEKAEWDAYQDKLEEQQRAEQKAKEIKQRKAMAEAKIAEAKKNGRDDDYSFSVDKEGYVIITLKTNKKLHEIRSEMGQNPGTLDDMNNFEARYGKIPVVSTDVRDIETWDNYEAKKGESFRLNTYEMSTSRTWTQFFKDLWPF